MSTSSYYYHRISSNSMEKYRDVQALDFEADIDDKEAHIQSLFTHRTPAPTGIWSHGDENIAISSERFTMFCVDGQPRDFTTWFDKKGQSKSLIPNHRANAMFDMGRFTSKECITLNGISSHALIRLNGSAEGEGNMRETRAQLNLLRRKIFYPLILSHKFFNPIRRKQNYMKSHIS